MTEATNASERINAESFDAAPARTTLEVATVLAGCWRSIATTAALAAAAAVGFSYVVAPTYTAGTVFMPPQQQQNSVAAMALASLGPLGSLSGASLKSSGEQYVALLQSNNIGDRIIDRFNLIDAYDVRLRSEARKQLGEQVKISLGKKDGLISVTVDDELSQRAADMANAYVSELRRLTSELALTEAQQRRVFFQGQRDQTRKQLELAQQRLEASGVTLSSINAEPKSAAEAYAKLKAEHTAAVVRLQNLRTYLNDQAVEVKQALSAISALQSKLNELSGPKGNGEQESSYLTKYREYKYQEALYETFSRQLELARVDEAREGALIQVVDVAQAPDRRSKPKRAQLAVAWGVAGLILASLVTLLRDNWRRQFAAPEHRVRWQAFVAAFKR